MRTFLITIITLLSFSLSVSAQKGKKNTIKYGYGNTYHSNEMLGNYHYGEYTRFMGKRFAFSLLGGYLNADNFALTDRISDIGFEAWKGDFNLYLLPLNRNNSSLKFGGGISGWTGDSKSRDTMDIDFVVTKEENYGWNAVAEFEIYIINTLVVGARAAYTQAIDEPKNNYYFFGLSAGLKF